MKIWTVFKSKEKASGCFYLFFGTDCNLLAEKANLVPRKKKDLHKAPFVFHFAVKKLNCTKRKEK